MFPLLYIDPGSGSIIVQAIIGLAAGAAFFIRLNWYRLKSWLGGGKKENEDSETENP